MTDIQITQRNEQPTAGIREMVPIADLTDFFGRAFDETMASLQSQGLAPVGPPFGKYYGTPGDVVDVEAGFPVPVTMTPAGKVTPGVLPGGRTVEATHVGPYDTMHQTYSEMERFIADAGLKPGDVMWESYLSDPGAEPDPRMWSTRICWPVTES